LAFLQVKVYVVTGRLAILFQLSEINYVEMRKLDR